MAKQGALLGAIPPVQAGTGGTRPDADASQGSPAELREASACCHVRYVVPVDITR